jgi:hypothetical protein
MEGRALSSDMLCRNSEEPECGGGCYPTRAPGTPITRGWNFSQLCTPKRSEVKLGEAKPRPGGAKSVTTCPETSGNNLPILSVSAAVFLF